MNKYIKDNNGHVQQAFDQLAKKLHFPQEKYAILQQAVTHAAFFEGHRHTQEGDYQRLEFLGDAVLDLIVGEYLYHAYPQSQEGDLSKMRAYIVCEGSLAQAAIELGLDSALRLGRGSEAGGDRKRPSVLADAFEAVLGAVFVVHGYDEARKLVLNQLEEKMKNLTPEDYEDKKSLLQELVQSIVLHGVSYKQLSVSGPAHKPSFETGVYCGKILLGTGCGGSKKESELAAAADALSKKEKWLKKIK